MTREEYKKQREAKRAQALQVIGEEVENLKAHGVKVREVKPFLLMIVVEADDLDKATQAKQNNAITIARNA